MGQLYDDFKKSSKFLKLANGETFEGSYVAWKKVTNSYGGESWRFTFEREDGSRVDWDTSNGNALKQFDALLDKGLKKGDPIKIVCHVVGQTKDGKNRYEYSITEETPF